MRNRAGVVKLEPVQWWVRLGSGWCGSPCRHCRHRRLSVTATPGRPQSCARPGPGFVWWVFHTPPARNTVSMGGCGRVGRVVTQPTQQATSERQTGSSPTPEMVQATSSHQQK